MVLLMQHVNDDPPPLASVRPDLPPGVVAWVHAMLAKDPAARPAGAAHAWDELEGVVSDALGPRWRRAATVAEPAAAQPPAEAELAPPSERSGIYSVVLPPMPVPSEPAEPTTAKLSDRVLSVPVQSQSAPDMPAWSAPVDSESLPAVPVRSARMHSHPIPDFPVPSRSAGSAADRPAHRRRPRRRTLLLALAGALLVAIAAILYSTAPGEEPRAAAQRPTGPSLDQRLRDALTPALRADARLSSELSLLVPGANPGDARDRARAAIPVTDAAGTAVRELRVTTAARAPPA